MGHFLINNFIFGRSAAERHPFAVELTSACGDDVCGLELNNVHFGSIVLFSVYFAFLRGDFNLYIVL